MVCSFTCLFLEKVPRRVSCPPVAVPRRKGGKIFVVDMSYRRSHRLQILLRNSYFRFKYHTQ